MQRKKRSKVRIAVAGAGQVGSRHIDLIAHSHHVQLSGIVDPALAYERGEACGVPVYESLAELFAKDRPDGVVIATPHRLHVEQGLECIAAGIPALIEKPVAHSVAAGLQLCEAAEAAQVPILVGHHRRHSAIMAKAVEIIDSGVLGQIVAVMGSFLLYKAESEHYYDGLHAWRREVGGGPLLINMIHEVGNLRTLCGEIEAVQAFSSNATRHFPVEDTASIIFRFTSGALGTFLLSDTAASDHSWEHTVGEDPSFDPAHADDVDCYHLTGAFGSLSIPTMRLRCFHRPAEQSWHKPLERSTVPVEIIDPLEQQMEHFGEVVRGVAKPLVSVHDGLQNLRVVEAIIEAAQTGQMINTL